MALVGEDEDRLRVDEILRRLELNYPGSEQDLCELNFTSAFQLLVATVLSAQCTDKVVNKVTSSLFARYPDAYHLAHAEIGDVESIVKPTGFYHNKAKNIVDLSGRLISSYGGEVPKDIDDLTKLPGVGRKTANVVLPIAFRIPGLAVDTHVKRLSRRLGLTQSSDPLKVEKDLCSKVEPSEWARLSLRLILHGRRVCSARAPECSQCFLEDLCPSKDTFLSGSVLKSP